MGVGVGENNLAGEMKFESWVILKSAPNDFFMAGDDEKADGIPITSASTTAAALRLTDCMEDSRRARDPPSTRCARNGSSVFKMPNAIEETSQSQRFGIISIVLIQIKTHKWTRTERFKTGREVFALANLNRIPLNIDLPHARS